MRELIIENLKPTIDPITSSIAKLHGILWHLKTLRLERVQVVLVDKRRYATIQNLERHMHD